MLQKIKNFFKVVYDHTSRLWIETSLTIGLGYFIYMMAQMEQTHTPGLIVLKMFLISLGIVHAHLVGKLLFKPKINWETPIQLQKGAFYARVGLYIVLPICYSIGG